VDENRRAKWAAQVAEKVKKIPVFTPAEYPYLDGRGGMSFPATAEDHLEFKGKKQKKEQRYGRKNNCRLLATNGSFFTG
jgi:hypothetical protein